MWQGGTATFFAAGETPDPLTSRWMQVLELGEIKAEIEHINSLGETEDLPPTYGEAEQSGARRSGRATRSRSRGGVTGPRGAGGRTSTVSSAAEGRRSRGVSLSETEGGGSDSGRRWPQLGASTITR